MTKIQRLTDIGEERIGFILNHLLKEEHGYREDLAKKIGTVDGENIVNLLASEGLISQGIGGAVISQENDNVYKRTWRIIERKVRQYMLLYAPPRKMSSKEIAFGEKLYKLGLR